MKKISTISRITTIFGLVLIMIYSQIPTFAQANTPDRSIEGTWQTQVTPVNCQTGATVAPTFPGILMFAGGGTLTGTSSTVPSAYGVWHRTGGWQENSFAFISLRYAPGGTTVIGTQIVRQMAKVSDDGDAFTSTGTVQFLDNAGNVVGSGCANSTGLRFN
jgi:hypothetical protein